MKLKIISFLLICSIFSECNEPEVEEFPITFDYEIMDDVSPVWVQFTCPQPVAFTLWYINDSIPIVNTEPSTSGEYYFRDSGFYEVRVEATDGHTQKFFGNTTLEIPGPATKLKVYGIDSVYLPTAPNLSDKYNINVEVYNDSIWETYSHELNTTDNYSTVFNEPMVFDVTDLTRKFLLAVRIMNETSGESVYYEYNYFTEIYFSSERLSHQIKLYHNSDEGIVYLNSDWMP